MEHIYRLYLTYPPHRDGFQGWLDEQEVIEIPADSMDIDGANAASENLQPSEDEFFQPLQQPALPLHDEGPPETFKTAYGVMFANVNCLTLKHAAAGRCVHYDDCPILQAIRELQSVTTCASCVDVVTETTHLYLHEGGLHTAPDCPAISGQCARTFVLCLRCLRRNCFC